MASETNALDQCKECIDSHRSFVLQGGAGSGKTESLKELLLYIKQAQPQARVVCITHTNAAVDEIVSRVGERYPISTIHSFLHGLIGNYKKNIKSVISELFLLPLMIRGDKLEDVSDADYKKGEYEKYKRLYEKYASKLFSICGENCEKAVGKREYDKNPTVFNQTLNNSIQALNEKISKIIGEKDYSGIYYNETKFDSLNDLSYGHDGLLSVFHLIFERYHLLGKMLVDKYDYIFIDEYQDTNADVLSDLLQLSSKYNITIGLFGDEMQSIYSDGIGNLNAYIKDGVLADIPKADNYRCSQEVIDFINPLRLDRISQNVAFKRLDNGSYETEADRHGIVKVLYAVTDKKPNAFSSSEEKDLFQSYINYLISEAQKIASGSKVLILTNKAIAEKNRFRQLYTVFTDRYVDVSDRIENYLRSIQALDVSDLCRLFIKGDFNELIKLVRKGGYVIHTVSDKKKLHDIMQHIVDNTDSSISEIIELAISQKLIKQTETCRNIFAHNANYLDRLQSDELYLKFKALYLNGQNTYSRIKDSGVVSSEEEFKYCETQWKRERFITELFSTHAKFSEVLNYAKYLDEGTDYITMHKTKGTSIPSVIVVMEEYFWNEYDFSLLYEPAVQKEEKRVNSRKLIYVACSRAKNNLVCIRVLTESEVEKFKQVFPQAVEVIIPSELSVQTN